MGSIHPGDRGMTFLPAVGRVSKAHFRVEALGDLDELSCILGLLAVRSRGAVRRIAVSIQRDLHDVMADVAVRGGRRMGRPHVARLESVKARLDSRLRPRHGFVVPGANEAEALAHIARAVCRRAERRLSAIGKPGLNPEALRYANRLSSLLFAVALTLAGRGRSG